MKDHLLTQEEFTISECVQCGFTFTSDAPDETGAGRYYETEDYIEHSDNKKGLINALYHWSRDRMVAYKRKLISKRTPANAKVLDIGSASGYFLNHMKQHSFDVTGVEISEKARQLCQKNFGIEAMEPDAWLNSEGKKEYDAITMWHVLEHVYPLEVYLEKIRASLKENGHAFIAVPNHTSVDAGYYKSAWAAYDVPRHIWHFDPSTFKQLVENQHFELVSMKSLPLDPFYISMVSADYTSAPMAKLVAPFVGLLSFLSGSLNVKKASSIIYTIKPKS